MLFLPPTKMEAFYSASEYEMARVLLLDEASASTG